MAHPFPPGDDGFRFFPVPTKKGKGVSFMENDPRWHSGAPNETEYAAAIDELLANLPADTETFTVPHTWPPPLQPEPLVVAYGAALLDAAERHPNLVVLDADLTRELGLVTFKERYPDRFFQIGIAEQDMVGIASGMAMNGSLPVVHSHAAFLTRRALDQVHNQVSERTQVIYVGGAAGKLQPNGNGNALTNQDAERNSVSYRDTDGSGGEPHHRRFTLRELARDARELGLGQYLLGGSAGCGLGARRGHRGLRKVGASAACAPMMPHATEQ